MAKPGTVSLVELLGQIALPHDQHGNYQNNTKKVGRSITKIQTGKLKYIKRVFT